MKIFLFNDNSKKLTIFHRPFTFNNDIVDNPLNANYILIKPEQFINFLNDKNMKNFHSNAVLYSNHDDPSFLLKENKIKKLIAQPLFDEIYNKKYNVISIPLVMTDHLKIHLDKNFLNKCRNQKKIYDYCFIGNILGKNRKYILQFKNQKNCYIDIKTTSIYKLNEKEKLKEIKKYLLLLSQSKFGFAPRGTGSSSFRLYECLMVGTTPISTDVIQYPFNKEVCWNNFSISGSSTEINSLITKSNNIEYEKYRQNGILFWENYVKIDNLFKKIISLL